MDTDIPNQIPVIEMTESPRRHNRASKPNLVAAGLAIVLAVGGGVALLNDRSSTTTAASSRLPKLKLGSPGLGATMESRSAMMPFYNYKYSHSGTWPALATTAPVYKLTSPSLDAAEASRLAAAFGVDGTAQANERGWLITQGDRQVSISPGDGGFSVALYNNVGVSVDGSVGTGSTTRIDNPDALAAPPVITTVPEPGVIEPKPEPKPEPEPAPMPLPKNLPSDSDAIKIAQSVIAKLGLDVAFEYESMNAATATVGGACAANTDCAIDVRALEIFSRSVIAHQLVDGQRVSGLTWSFEIGDNGALQSAYGTIANLEKLGDYPLRPVQSVYDDLVNGTFYQGQPMPLGAAEVDGSSTSASRTNDVEVALPAPPASGNAPKCLANDCAISEPGVTEPGVIEPGVIEPGTTIVPVVATVNVTGVRIASQVWYGFDGTTGSTYIVPMYSFSGTVSSTDDPSSPWTSDSMALDQSFVDTTSPPAPEPIDGGTKVTIEPQPGEPGVSEPGVSEPGVSEPGVSEPGVSEPGVTGPDVTEPGVIEPDFTEPGGDDPSTTDPAVDGIGGGSDPDEPPLTVEP